MAHFEHSLVGVLHGGQRLEYALGMLMSKNNGYYLTLRELFHRLTLKARKTFFHLT